MGNVLFTSMNSWMRGILFLLLLVTMARGAGAQVTTRISAVEPAETFSRYPVTISAVLQQTESVERMSLLYRPFGESDYRRADMDITGSAAVVVLPANVVVPPFLEYYIVIAMRSGVLETYPVSETANPFVTPPGNTLRLTVLDETAEEADAVFLSPERFAAVNSEDVVVSVSLLRADSSVVRSATQMFLDGADVTAGAVFSDDLIVFVPDNVAISLSPGVHRVTVRLYDGGGNLYRVASLPFTVLGDRQFLEVSPRQAGFQYGLSLQAESRREQVRSVGTWYNRGGVQIHGKYDTWRLASNLFVTSDEKPDRQPQNRYFIGAESPWLRAGYGDSYPAFPDLILSGKRVRGLNAGIRLGFFNLDLSLGSLSRAIDGSLIRSFPADSLGLEYARDPDAAYGPVSGSTWGKFSYGTYARDLFAIRPSFGSGATWQLGFTFLKAKDDVGSILFGIRPQENVILGTDVLWKLDDGRVEFSGQGAFSAYNSDIKNGSFTDAYIDSVYTQDASTVRSTRDLLKPFITVNENLRPLSLRKMSTLAYDMTLALRYFDHAMKITYLFRGSDYVSFGQSFLRKDVRGFNILDRLHVMRNQIFVTIGYERLEDNTSDSKAATTVYSNVSASVSYYSREQLPNITAGFARLVNENGLRAAGPDSLSMVSDVTSRVYLQSSYDFFYGAQHTAAVSVAVSDRADRSPRALDVRNLTIALGLSSRFAFPLQTAVDVAVTTNDLPPPFSGGIRRTLNYTSLAFTGKYALLDNVVTCSAGLSPSFGDFRRTVVDLGAEWSVMTAMSVILQFTYFGNGDAPDDNVCSLRYRYDI